MKVTEIKDFLYKIHAIVESINKHNVETQKELNATDYITVRSGTYCGLNCYGISGEPKGLFEKLQRSEDKELKRLFMEYFDKEITYEPSFKN